MKKRYYMKTERNDQGYNITTVYEYFVVEEGEIISDMTFSEYMRQKENGTPIATYTSETTAERYIMNLYKKQYTSEVSQCEN